MIKSIFMILACILFCQLAMAGPYTVDKNKACPDAWAITSDVIPEVNGTNASPWGVNTSDKAIGKTHLIGAAPIQTIDAVPVTDDDLIDDLLTVASECLMYRNFEVDTFYYVAPPPTTPNIATGWLPATW